MPQWCKDRYKAADITFKQVKAEDYCSGHYDESIMYNTLQHVENPAKIVSNMLSYSKLVRVHEWLDTPISDGHIHTLKEAELNEWFDGKGFTGYETWGDHKQFWYAGVFAGNSS
jgi:hypothetical protein